MKVVGLTGGIGMGKSFVAGVFRREGVAVFDADAAVHRLQARGGAALPAIARAFPGVVAWGEGGGVLDRAALRVIVLGDPAARRRLEAVVHPLVRAAQARFVARARAEGRSMVVMDVPLLFETGGEARVDCTVVVSAPGDVQRARVRARRRMSDAQVDAMIALQMPDAEKRARADYVVRTGLSRFHAVRAVRRLLRGKEGLLFKKRSKNS